MLVKRHLKSRLAPVRDLLISTSIAFGLISLFNQPKAHAFECIAIDDGPSSVTQAWNQRCIPYFIAENDPIFGQPEYEALVHESFDVWALNECTDLSFLYAGVTSNTAVGVGDAASSQNMIISVSDPDEYRDDITEFTVAFTLAAFDTLTGELFDADIIFNARDNYFADLTDSGPTCAAERVEGRFGPYDIRSILVHEIGHLLGFEHVGDPEATMFPTTQPCETGKATLSSDELNAVCSVYPAGQGTDSCTPPPGGYRTNIDPRARRQCDRILGNLDSNGCSGYVVHEKYSPPYAFLLLLILAWFFRRSHFAKK